MEEKEAVRATIVLFLASSKDYQALIIMPISASKSTDPLTPRSSSIPKVPTAVPRARRLCWPLWAIRALFLTSLNWEHLCMGGGGYNATILNMKAVVIVETFFTLSEATINSSFFIPIIVHFYPAAHLITTNNSRIQLPCLDRALRPGYWARSILHPENRGMYNCGREEVPVCCLWEEEGRHFFCFFWGWGS